MFYIISLFVVLLVCKMTSILFNYNVIFVQPLWGIGNRLRTIRKAFSLAKYLNRELVIIEHVDDGLAISMKKLFGIRLRHIPLFIFKLLYENNCRLFRFNDQCTLKHKVKEFEDVKKQNMFIKACDLNIKGVDLSGRDIYDNWEPYNDLKTQSIMRQIKKHSHVVGVHIRQGNVNDWDRGYFFNDEWKDIKIKEPDSAPHFCCYDSKEKNLSSCTSNIQPLDVFINKMKTYPKETTFYVCSDRVGCVIHLYQLFPGRILSNEIEMETSQLNIYKSMQDFLCLSKCHEIIVSNISSFSDESRLINNIKVIKI
jgi:hypothetical protein